MLHIVSLSRGAKLTIFLNYDTKSNINLKKFLFTLSRRVLQKATARHMSKIIDKKVLLATNSNKISANFLHAPRDI